MRRILTARERVAVWHGPTKIYRGFNIDTSAPGLEKVHAILHPPGQTDPHHPGWDHPEVGGHLLNWLQTKSPKGGIGTHWSTDPTQAENFARWPDEKTGHGGNLQLLIEGDWGGDEGEDLGRTDTHEFSPTGERIRSFPEEKEVTLRPDAPVDVTGMKIRPYDDHYWNSPSTADEPVDKNHEGPWHQVLKR